ncbi:MAG: MarR family transcriptional regulator [Pseudomonadota bacterium]
MEQTARAVYDRRSPQDIHPGQWSALRYFARAGRAAATVNGLARYLGVTSGPASRAIAALQRNGFLTAEPNPEDGRSQLYALTEKGKATLHDDPAHRLALAIAGLPDEAQDRLADSLELIYQHLETKET